MEFDEIVVKESPGLCRCCLSEGCYKDLGTEYVWMDDTEVYADMLLECFDIGISQHMEGPNGPNRLICEVCITRLRDACNFKKQVLESEQKFIDMVGRGDFKNKVYQDQLKCEITLEGQPVNADVEFLDEDVDYDDPPNNDEATVSEDITVSTLPIKSKRGRPKKTVVKEKKKTKTEEKAKTKVKDDEQYDLCISERRRKNLQTLFNNTSIIPFKWMGRYICFYCGQNYNEYHTLRKHTKSHGMCDTTDNALKTIKGNNIEIKIDVSEMTCEICNEPLTSLDEIVDHLTGKHELEYDRSIETSIQEYQLVDCRCRICGQKFTCFGYLISHINIAHPPECFMCDNCGETFNNKKDLIIHLRRYHRDEEESDISETQGLLNKHRNHFPFRICKICDARFPSLTLLKRHVQSDHFDDHCPYCSKNCQTSQGLKDHIMECTKKNLNVNSAFSVEKRKLNKKKDINQIRKNIQCVLNMSTAVPFKFFTKYSCFYCSKSYVEFEELKDHVVAAHPVCDLNEKCMKNCKGERITVKIDISSLACKVCSVPVESVDLLIEHLISKHRADYDKSITGCFEPFEIIKDCIPCPNCSAVFRYFGSLLRHINSEHSNNNRICDFCGRSYKNVSNLKVHLTYAHTGACECDICGAKYKNQWCLGRHKAKCHDVKDFQCTKCSERFQSQYHKQKHLIKVHDIGHKCSYCGKMFTRNSFMKDHIRRTHLKEKNVPCTVCNEKFFDNYLLKLHMVKHKGERKFSCEVCNKTFLRRSNLNAHKEMHKKYGHA